MNTMVPGYAFNLAPERFDTHVTSVLGGTRVTRHARDRLIAEVRGGRFDHLLLKRLAGLEGLPDAVNERAAINIIDFHFEPIVLKGMSGEQVATYFQSVEKTLSIGEAAGIDGDGPLWIDSVHHACIFSVLYQLALYLVLRRGYTQLVLLHQGQRPEPRLGIIGKLLRQFCRIEPVFMQLRGAWFPKLAKMTTPQTAIFYLTDMPPEVAQRGMARERGLSHLQLFAPPNFAIELSTLSGSGAFARRLKATHIVVEYPRPDRIRIRPYDAEKPTALCPLEDWVFWPLLDVRAGAAA